MSDKNIRVFFDLDETLIHTEVHSYDDRCEKIELYDGDYHFRIKPDALDAIRGAMELVGKENVFILTIATRAYAEAILKIAKFGIPMDRVFAREDIANQSVSTGYCATSIVPHKDLCDTRNILIDNRKSGENYEKIAFLDMNMKVSNYMKVRDYFGVDFPGDSFADDVIEFINERV